MLRVLWKVRIQLLWSSGGPTQQSSGGREKGLRLAAILELSTQTEGEQGTKYQGSGQLSTELFNLYTATLLWHPGSHRPNKG